MHPIYCAPDADHYEYSSADVEDSREGAEDGDLY